MKNMPIQCQGEAKGKQCGNLVANGKVMCWLHQNSPAFTGQSKPEESKIPRVSLAAILKPKRTRTSDDDFSKPHYLKPDKEPADLSGLEGEHKLRQTSQETLMSGIHENNPLMVAAGTAGLIVSASKDLSEIRLKHGINPGVREFGLTAEMEAAELESRRIIMPSAAVEALVREHWVRLEVRAEQAGVELGDRLNIERFSLNFVPSASNTYRTFREQFYALAAQENPADAVRERADEIDHWLDQRVETDKPKLVDALKDPILYAVSFRSSSEDERKALREVAKELRELSSSLFTQELLEAIGDGDKGDRQ